MRGAVLVAAVLVSLLDRSAAAQWVVDASAGRTDHDAVAASAGTHSAMVGVRYVGSHWGYLSAGAPMDSAGLPWAAAGVGTRAAAARLRGLELGTNLSAQGQVYRATALDTNGGGLVLDLVPYLTLERAAARLELGSGVRSYLSTVDDSTASRTLSETHASLVAMPVRTVAIALRGRYVRAEEGGYPFARATVDVAIGPGIVSLDAGRWLSNMSDGAAWGAAARVSLDTRTTAYVGIEQEPPDPHYWNDLRRSWTIGLSRSPTASRGGRRESAGPPARQAAVRPAWGDPPRAFPLGGRDRVWAARTIRASLATGAAGPPRPDDPAAGEARTPGPRRRRAIPASPAGVRLSWSGCALPLGPIVYSPGTREERPPPADLSHVD